MQEGIFTAEYELKIDKIIFISHVGQNFYRVTNDIVITHWGIWCNQ